MSHRSLATLGVIALLALTACSSGGGGAPAGSIAAPTTAASEPATGGACTPTPAAGTVNAAMAEITFAPAQLSAKVGDVIAWTNNDSVPHTATLKDDPACTTANLAAGETGALTFTAAGTYAFFCKIHSSMTGTIEITG